MTLTQLLAATPSLTGAERALAGVVWQAAQEPLLAEIAELRACLDMPTRDQPAMFVSIDIDDGHGGVALHYASPDFGGKRLPGRYVCYLVEDAK